MTNREFFVSVSKGIVGEAEVAHALEQIAKLDATNAKRAEKAKEKATGNEPIKTAIFNLLTEKGGMTSPDIAEALKAQGVVDAEGKEISTSKASSMCRQMVEESRLTVAEIKVPKKGKLKQYAVATTADAE